LIKQLWLRVLLAAMIWAVLLLGAAALGLLNLE
jgi:hypothetical protein